MTSAGEYALIGGLRREILISDTAIQGSNIGSSELDALQRVLNRLKRDGSGSETKDTHDLVSPPCPPPTVVLTIAEVACLNRLSGEQVVLDIDLQRIARPDSTDTIEDRFIDSRAHHTVWSALRGLARRLDGCTFRAILCGGPFTSLATVVPFGAIRRAPDGGLHVTRRLHFRQRQVTNGRPEIRAAGRRRVIGRLGRVDGFRDACGNGRERDQSGETNRPSHRENPSVETHAAVVATSWVPGAVDRPTRRWPMSKVSYSAAVRALP